MQTDIDRSRLYVSPDFEVLRTRWDPGRHARRCEAVSRLAAVELMRHGSFVRTRARERIVGDASTAVLFNPGEPFRVSHAVDHPNCGTTIRLLPPGVERMLKSGACGRAVTSDRPFAVGMERALSSRARLLHVRLVRRLENSAAPCALEIEELTIGLLRQVLACPGRPGRDSLSLARVALAREFLAANVPRRITLEQVGAAAGCSSWTICREFRAHTGFAVHRHLVRLRLSAALRLIGAGADNLTRVALESGFCSHSHMTAWFRRDLGMPPRTARDSLVGRLLALDSPDLSISPGIQAR